MSVFIIALCALLADQFTKYAIVSSIPLHETRPFVSGLFVLTHHTNTGAAWSVGAGNNVLFIIVISVILVAIITTLFRYRPLAPIVKIGAGLIIGGALGNLVDRFTHGAVIDFLQFTPFDFPVFNVADCCITIGAALVCWHLLRTPQTQHEKA